MAAAADLNHFFLLFIDTHPKLYIERLYHGYTTSQDIDILRDANFQLGNILTPMQVHEGDALELVGLGPEWRRLQSWVTLISQVIRWVEEMLCLAMIDIEDLRVEHRKKKLMYQYQ